MPFFKNSVLRQVQDDSRSNRVPELSFPIWGRDVHPDYVEGSKANALRARVEKHLDLGQLQFFESKKPTDHGLMFANLPYDRRLKKGDDFFERFSSYLTKEYSGWDFAIFALKDTFSPPENATAKKVFEVSNGSLDTQLFSFKL